MRGSVLIVDDDRDMCEVLDIGLKRREFKPTWKTSAEEAFDLLKESEYDAVVTDLNMPGIDGIQFCERITSNRSDIPVVVITAFGSLDTAVAAIRAGAYDFITKPFDTDELALALDRAVQHRMLTEEVKRLRIAVAETQKPEDIVGDSPAMRKLFDLMSRMSDADSSVLITGETGTGKELVARALHRQSRRAGQPFVAINCAAMPETLLESELFGHAKGAFTDAKADHKGLFLRGDMGTLFLDEIGSMPVGLQAKLLRALQEHRVRPVGSDTEEPFDARIIAATNSDLETAVDEGRFRSDLFFRINVIHVEVPPLRSRGTDALLLAQHFIDQFAARMDKRVLGLSSATADKLLSYSWPGNVRELQNCIERAVALTTYELLTVEDLPEKIRNYSPSHIVLASDNPAELVSMEEVERRYILRVLDAVRGNKTMAARVLGFNRKTLYRKLSRYLPEETVRPNGVNGRARV